MNITTETVVIFQS